MKYRFSTFLLAVTIVLFSACEKGDDNNDDGNNNNETKATIKAELTHLFQGENFELDKYYTLSGSTKVKFSVAQFYLGNPMFMDDAMERTMLEPQFTFVENSTTEIDFGKVNPGHMHMFMFGLGVDSTTNATVQPTDFSNPNAPLAPKTVSMYWSWSSGFIFYKFEGAIDIDGDGTDDDNFKYHIGTDAMLINKSTVAHSDLEAGKTTEIHMHIDYAKIFDGLDMTNDILTMTMNNPALAAKIKANFDKAVEVDIHGH